MCKFVLRGKHVQNLGGFIVEIRAKLPYRDIVVGNPFDEPVQIPVPVFSVEEIEKMKELGLIVKPVYDTDRVLDVIASVKKEIEALASGKQQSS